MKIFFSYPHDANIPLVGMIRTDLEARGHEVWVDQTDIKAGDDWRGRITRGILDSERVVAFLSKHGTRDPGVCLNEIAIALSEKGDHLLSVLVEPEDVVRAPVSITHLQFLRMETWPELHARGGDDWTGWYRGKLDELLAVLENPRDATRDADLESLRQKLKPLSHYAEIARHIPTFTGREWIFERYAHWLSGSEESKVLRIEGGPGMGKSAIAARLAHSSKNTVIAMHLCRHNQGETRDPRRMVLSLAYQLATRLPDYRARLLRSPILDEVEKHDAPSLWSELIAEPLHGQIERQRLAIVIDGLDEATEGGDNAIVKLLAAEIEKLPRWIGVVVTGRSDPEVAQRLTRYRPEVLSGEDPANVADLRAYLEQWLASEPLSSSERERTTATLLERSEGIFLYVTEVRAEARLGRIDLKRPEAFPQGLSGVYRNFFERRFADAERYKNAVRPLLELLLASPEPLPVALARDMLRWDDYAEAEILEQLGSLFPVRNSAVAPFHSSVRNWLGDRTSAGAQFMVSAATARGRLGARLMNDLIHNQSWGNFVPISLPMLIAGAGAEEAATWARPASAMAARRLLELAKALVSVFLWQRAVAVYAAAELIAEAAKEHGGDDKAPELILEVVLDHGDLLMSLGCPADALLKFQRSASLAMDRACLGSDDLQRTHREVIIQQRLSWAQLELERHEEALDHAKCSLKLAQDAIDRFPDVPYLVLGKSASLQNVGLALFKLGRHEEALATFLQAAQLGESICARAPGNDEYARSLSIMRERIAEVLSVTGRNDEALVHFHLCLRLRERLSASAPEDSERLREWASGCKWIADTLLSMGRNEEALEHYRRCNSLREQATRIAPVAGKRPSWAVDYYRTGKLLAQLGRNEEALEVYLHYCSECEELARDQPHNLQRLRDLATSQAWVADAMAALGRHEEALEYYRRDERLGEEAVRQAPQDLDLLHEFAISQRLVASTLDTLGRREEALAQFRKCLATREGLIARAPETEIYLIDVLICHKALARLEQDEQAPEHRRRCLAVLKKLRVLNPGNPEYPREIAIAHDKAGGILASLGRHEEALAEYQRDVEIMEQVVAAEPRNAAYQRELATEHDKLASAHLKLGQMKEAMEHFGRSLTLSAELVKRNPDDLRSYGIVSLCAEHVSDLLLGIEMHEKALDQIREAIRYTEHVAKNATVEPGVVRNLARYHRKAATILDGSPMHDEALSHYEKMHSLIEQLHTVLPDDTSVTHDLAASLQGAGRALMRLERGEDALTKHARALSLAEELERRSPDDLDTLSVVSDIAESCGSTLSQLGRNEEALAAARKYLALREAISRLQPDNPVHLVSVAAGHENVGTAHAAQGQFIDAIEHFRGALEIRAAIARAIPGEVNLLLEVARVHFTIGRAYEGMGQNGEALAAYKEAEALLVDAAQQHPKHASEIQSFRESPRSRIRALEGGLWSKIMKKLT
jgi:tetratricopeptide (TPR) repeat protein